MSILLDGADGMGLWTDQDLVACRFADARLGKRLGMLMEQLSKGLGQTLALACGDWAATEAAYRFLDNDRVGEQEILAGHFQATQQRFAATDRPILVLHETAEFLFTRSDTRAIGLTRKVPTRPATSDGRSTRLGSIRSIAFHRTLGNQGNPAIVVPPEPRLDRGRPGM